MTTAEELVNAVGSIGLTKGKFTCDYCKKSFQREGTLLAHSCEKKRRWQSKLNQDVLVGFADPITRRSPAYVFDLGTHSNCYSGTT